MADKPETPKILEEISKGTNPKSGGGSSRSQKNARRRFLIILLLFLPLLAGMAYLGYTQFNLLTELASMQQQNAALNESVAEYQTELNALRSQVDNMPAQVTVDTEAIDALSSRLDTDIDVLTQEIVRLDAQQSRIATPQNSQWKIFEANYFVQLANRKLQLEGDSRSAIELLEQADAALLESESNAVLRARQAVADDISMLRELELLDREGLFIRLDNLSDQINGINLLTSMRESLQNRSESTDEQSTSESSGFIDSGMAFLGSVFVWRTWEDSPEAMLAPGQEALIQQRVQLSVEQAKVALLNSNNALYQRSLGDISDWIRQYATSDSSAGQQVLAELAELVQIEIDSALPELSQSMASLQQLTTTLQ